jgi:hypothetical protein
MTDSTERTLRGLENVAKAWLDVADTLDDEGSYELPHPRAYQLRDCAAQVLDLLGLIDTQGSASRQHYIETGRYIRFDEEV